MELEYDNVELQMNDIIGNDNSKVIEKSTNHESVMIKKQSKDETIEVISDDLDDLEQEEDLQDVQLGNSVLKTLNDIVQSYLPTAIQPVKPKFDPEDFYRRLIMDNLYRINTSWVQDHGVMSCPAQSFVERFSIQGEFFDIIS
jgi:hypothetical protein